MKGLALGVLLCCAYVFVLTGIFESDYGKSHDLRFTEPTEEFSTGKSELPDSESEKNEDDGTEAASANDLQGQIRGLSPIDGPVEDVIISPASYSIQPGHSKGLVLECTRTIPVELEVYDLSGKPVFHRNGFLPPGKHELQMNFEYVPDGIYFLKVSSEKGHSLKKFVKAR